MTTATTPSFAISTELQAMLADLASPLTPIAGAVAGSYMFDSLPASLYHSDRNSLSSSMLKPLLMSPAHFQKALVEPFKRTDAMDFGTLLHLMVLEPHLLGKEVAIWSGRQDMRDDQFKKFLADNPGKLVVDEEDFARARALVPKVLSRTYKGRAIGKFLEESLRENSIYFTDPTTGLQLRIRPDIYHPDVTFDLKTTRCTTGHQFVRDAISLHYDLSAFMYTLGRSLYEGTEKHKPFVFATVESDSPHSVCVIEAGSSFLQNGAKKYQECLAVFKACSDTNYWPDLGVEMVAEIEPWQQYNPPTSDWRTN